MKSKFNLTNKKILITGGSLGLGRALALQLTNLGASVAVIARDGKKLAELKNQQPKIKTIIGDISSKGDIHRIYAEALGALEGIDILINNASSLGTNPLRLLIDTDCEDFLKAIETNLLGAFRLTKLILPSMILQKQGVVVNISTDAAIQNYPYWGAYSISKSALDHMTRIFQAELSDTSVRFLAVDPGDMNTALHLTAIPDADTTKLYSPDESAKLLINLLESNNFSSNHRGLR